MIVLRLQNESVDDELVSMMRKHTLGKYEGMLYTSLEYARTIQGSSWFIGLQDTGKYQRIIAIGLVINWTGQDDRNYPYFQVYVDKRFRRRGYGSQIYADALALYPGLVVDHGDEEPSMDFYDSLGATYRYVHDHSDSEYEEFAQ